MTLHPVHGPMCFAHSSVRSDTRISLVGTNFIPNIFLLRDAAPCSRSHVLRTFLCTERYSPFARGNKFMPDIFLLRDAAPCSRCSVTLHPVHGPMCFAHSSVRSDTRLSLVGTNLCRTFQTTNCRGRRTPRALPLGVLDVPKKQCINEY